MAKLYTEEGWLDFDKFTRLSSTFNVVLGPRNAGKTYGKMLYNHVYKIPYVFMRTTKKALSAVFTPEMSPFEKLNNDIGSRYICTSIPRTDIIAVYGDYKEKEGKRQPSGPVVNFCLALTDIASIRGFNLDQVEEVVYDEFVKHPGEVIQNYKDSARMYMDIIFTINRSRELAGRPPLKQWLFGNSDNLAVPILYELGLVNRIISMRLSNENYLKIPERDISIFLCDDSPSAARMAEESSLSKVFQGTDYLDMAVKNEFIYDDFDNCRMEPIKKYVPEFTVAGIMVMSHKKEDRFYVRPYNGYAAGVTNYGGTKREVENCRQENAYLVYYYMEGLILFSTYNEKVRFKRIFNIDV